MSRIGSNVSPAGKSPLNTPAARPYEQDFKNSLRETGGVLFIAEVRRQVAQIKQVHDLPFRSRFSKPSPGRFGVTCGAASDRSPPRSTCLPRCTQVTLVPEGQRKKAG